MAKKPSRADWAAARAALARQQRHGNRRRADLIPDRPGMVRVARRATETTYGCRRGCPDGECYCQEPTIADTIATPNEQGMCTGCGGIGECYCGED